MHGTNVVNKKS